MKRRGVQNVGRWRKFLPLRKWKYQGTFGKQKTEDEEQETTGNYHLETFYFLSATRNLPMHEKDQTFQDSVKPVTF